MTRKRIFPFNCNCGYIITNKDLNYSHKKICLEMADKVAEKPVKRAREDENASNKPFSEKFLDECIETMQSGEESNLNVEPLLANKIGKLSSDEKINVKFRISSELAELERLLIRQDQLKILETLIDKKPPPPIPPTPKKYYLF
jgi:hypothetical protein